MARPEGKMGTTEKDEQLAAFILAWHKNWAARGSRKDLANTLGITVNRITAIAVEIRDKAENEGYNHVAILPDMRKGRISASVSDMGTILKQIPIPHLQKLRKQRQR